MKGPRYTPLYTAEGTAVLFGVNTAVFLVVLFPCWIGLGFGINYLFGDLIGSRVVVVLSLVLSIGLALLASKVTKKMDKNEDHKEKLKGLAVVAKFEEKQIEERRKRAERQIRK